MTCKKSTLVETIVVRVTGLGECPDRITKFERDSNGAWWEKGEEIYVRDIIQYCRKADNWPEIRKEHFPMVGL